MTAEGILHHDRQTHSMPCETWEGKLVHPMSPAHAVPASAGGQWDQLILGEDGAGVAQRDGPTSCLPKADSFPQAVCGAERQGMQL